MESVISKSKVYEIELENQIKSNRSLIYITTHEEHRVDDAIQAIACRRAKPWSFVFWDIASPPITNSSLIKAPVNVSDQLVILNWFRDLIVEKDDFCVLVLHDFYKFLSPDGSPGQAEIEAIRSLKNLVEQCNTEKKCVILTAARYFMPLEFEKLVCLIDWPLPEKEIIIEKFDNLLLQVEKNPQLKKFKTNYTQSEKEEVVRAFQGLTLREIEMISTYFILTEDQFYARKIASKKKDIIKKSGILEWIDVEFDLSEVGGLDNLKGWLSKRKNAFSQRAVEYGLPISPKGLLLIGIQGAGKSRASQAIASYWSLPLLRLDVGRIFAGVVGSSEENLRSVIKVAESVSPCIMWCDEMDKAFSNQSFSSDSGTSSRVLGTFLVWMQEKQSAVFVVATANNIENLPPELIRKGRFDDIFFVDLPDQHEREEIWNIHLRQRGFDAAKFDVNKLILASNGFTGAEIEAAIISAMYEGFSDNERPISTVDILKELKESVPIYITMKEKIEALRTWASQRARNASKSKISVVIEEYKKADEEEEL